MPPEQAAGELSSVDARSDVYSLGAALYHALTGRMPFRGRTEMEILLKVLRADLRPPSAYAPIPPEIEAIVLKAMEPEPARRYPTARELAADLQRFLDGESVRAKPPGTLERAARALRRRPLAIRRCRPRAWHYRAFASVCMGRPDESLGDFRQAIRIEPGNPLHYVRRAVAYRRLLLFDKALADLDAVIRVEPKHIEARMARGNVYYETGEYAKAIEDYTRAIGLGAGAAAYAARAVAKIAVPDFDAALGDLDRAIELDASSWYPRFARGRIHLHRKRVGDAIADFDAALRLNAAAHEVRFWRAKTKLANGDRPVAKSDFETFVARAPNHALAAEAAGEIAKLEGRE